MKHRFNVIDSPLGPISTAVNEAGAVVWVAFGDARQSRSLPGIPLHATLCFEPSATHGVDNQLTEYFAGERKTFELELAPVGTAFQRTAWAALVQIPYGETRTYGQQAALLGTPQAARAVGRANATNPIAIIVPCHRVIGAKGDLTGYASGLAIKEKLLALEKAS